MARRVLLHMFLTIDGVAEYPVYEDPSEPGAPSDDEPTWLPDLDSIDTLLLGRNTYLKWAEFWPPQKSDPSANEFMRTFSLFADRAEKVVFSRTLDRADWPRSRIVRSDLAEEIARIRSTPGGDIALAGGPRLAQAFLARDLVDEMFLKVFPTLAGKGKPLFQVQATPDNPEDMIPLGAPGRTDFQLLHARALSDSMLALHYRRRR
jgi:dihydrofolate reductase